MTQALTRLKAASFFGAFTTPLKLTVINALLPGPNYPTAIGRITDLDQPVVSQTLAIFRALGIVSRTKQGRRTMYQLTNPEAMQQLLTIAENFNELATRKAA